MIQITQRIHLLHCVVPAATVRAGEAPGIGERAVPAEREALRQALRISDARWRMASESKQWDKWDIYRVLSTALRRAIGNTQSRASLGGNAKGDSQSPDQRS
jgi:hypothetical protein